MTELWQFDAHRIAAMIRSGEVSAREVTTAVLDRATAVNPSVRALTEIHHEEAIAEAEARDAQRSRGETLGVLHGVPVTTKINVDQAGVATDHGVPALKDLQALEDGPIVANLRRAGAVLIGRNNAPAFSMRAHTDNALHGPTYNPWNRALTPGGSSGGAAAAVAVGIGPIAHGNDIGGSIRWPAYCCGVVGLRPTPGRVSHMNPGSPGGRPLCSQLMAVNGPLARSVRDLRAGLQAMSAPDLRDHRWTPVALEGPPPVRPLRVAMVTMSEGPHVDPDVWGAVRSAGVYLQQAGYAVEEVMPPRLHAVSELWHALGTTEQFHTLGPKLALGGDPGISQFLAAWWDLRPPLDLAGYLGALAQRDELISLWTQFLERYPIVIMPSAPGLPPPAGCDVQGPEGAQQMLDALYYQLTLPVLGLPGAAVPLGFAKGHPLGVQVVGPRWREDLVLDAAEIIEAREGVREVIDPRP
jgi:amidase